MKRSRETAVTAAAEVPKCASCRRELTGTGESWWWCSEDCFYEWQRARHAWTA